LATDNLGIEKTFFKPMVTGIEAFFRLIGIKTRGNYCVSLYLALVCTICDFLDHLSFLIKLRDACAATIFF